MPRQLARILALTLLAPLAHAATYTLAPVTIPVAGANTITLGALNGAGDYAGTYRLGQETYGFAVYHGGFQTLPPIPGTPAPPQPTAITLDGTIAGIYQQNSANFGTGGFVYANGTYTTPIFGQYGIGGQFFLTDGGLAAFWYTPDAGMYLSFRGTRDKLKPLSINFNQPYYLITGQNEFGDIAGQASYEPFACFGARCELLLPNGLVSNPTPAVINDAGQVAGVAQNSSSNNIFLYDHGQLTTYPISGVVGGLSDSGTIAGVLNPPDQHAPWQAFALKHGHLTRIGKFPAYPVVIGITHNGDVALVFYGQRNNASLIAKCTGADC